MLMRMPFLALAAGMQRRLIFRTKPKISVSSRYYRMFDPSILTIRSAHACYRSSDDAKIPKRGEKDFEPHATALQSNTLAASRQAMHNALAFPRVHAPKGHVEATYHPESNMAYAQNPKGPLFAKMGHVRSAHDDPFGNDPQRGQRLWLLPEEVLYLLERGTIDVAWPGEDALPMSLQGAYAMFIGDDEQGHGGKLTLERYSVYANLKRMGYTVLRAPSWDAAGPSLGPECFPPSPQRTWQAGLNPAGWWRAMLPSSANFTSGSGGTGADPLVQPGCYRDYMTIYRRLALVDFHDPTTHSSRIEQDLPSTDPNFRITYHVWKPGSTTFKKSAPGTPDFRIAVVNARDTTAPTLDQLSALLETVPFDPPKPDGQLYAKLRYGYKNVILAIVDQGVTSYLRIGDAAFGKHKLYERKGPGPGGKRGGRSNRGRGRGR